MLIQVMKMHHFGTWRLTAHTLALLALSAGVGNGQSAGGSASSMGAPTSEIAGLWIDHTEQGAVEIKPCGTNMCGYIAWIKKPTDAKGQPVADVHNPDRARRTAPLCGLQIIGNLTKPATGARYDQGWIYNPEDGERFSVDVRLKSKDQLEVHGFLGMRFLGETFLWRRAPLNQERCKA
jgi:uncharacterized protein (DUF2147 family)